MRIACEKLGWEECEREEEWSIAWIDGRVIDDNWFRELKQMQRVNHFPGMNYIPKLLKKILFFIEYKKLYFYIILEYMFEFYILKSISQYFIFCHE